MKQIISRILVLAFILLPTSVSAQLLPEVDGAVEISTDSTTWSASATGPVNVAGSLAGFRVVLTPASVGDPVIGNPVSIGIPAGTGFVQVSLRGSDNLSDWSTLSPGLFPVDPKVFLRVETSEAMSLAPAGTFMMGSLPGELGRFDDEALHAVELTRSFYVQQTEVTKAQWDAVGAQGEGLGYTDLPPGRNGFSGDASGQHPVTEVSWFDAIKWLNLLSELHGLAPCYTVTGLIYRTGETIPVCNFDASGFRLPSEAEWEYACRAGTTTAFYNGPITSVESDPNLDQIGWYLDNSENNTHPVAEKIPNAWGLFDMSGNILEWCWDWYDAYPDNGEDPPLATDLTDPEGPAEPPPGSLRVLRGGSFGNIPGLCRSALRNAASPDFPYDSVGFRPVRTATP